MSEEQSIFQGGGVAAAEKEGVFTNKAASIFQKSDPIYAAPSDPSIFEVGKLFGARANLREQYANQMRAISEHAGVELGDLTRDSAIEQMVNEIIPVSNGARSLEAKWKPYNGTDEYLKLSSARQASDAVASGLNRGMFSIAQSTEYIGYLSGKLTGWPVNLFNWAVNELTGTKLSTDVAGDSHRKAVATFDKLFNLAPNREQILGKDLALSDPYKLTGLVSEQAPALVLAMLTGGFGGAATRGQMLKQGAGLALAKTAAEQTAQRVTASTFAALGMHGTYDAVNKEALKRGYSPEQADALGITASLVLLPVNYKINLKTMPLAQIAGGKPLAQTLVGQLIDTAANNAVQSGASRASLELVRQATGLAAGTTKWGWVPVPNMTQQAWAESWSNTLSSAGEGAVVGGVTGLALHAVDRGAKLFETPLDKQQVMVDLLKNQYGKDLDTATPRDFYRTLRAEFGVERGEARDLTYFMSTMMKEAGRQRGVTEGEAWTSFYARNSERANAAEEVFFQRDKDRIIGPDGFFSKLRTVVATLPSKGELPADQILATLTNAGVKREELVWTGMESLLKEVGKSGASLSRVQLAEYLNKHETRIAFVQKDKVDNSAAQSNEVFRKFEAAEKEYYKLQEVAQNATLPPDKSRQANVEAEKFYSDVYDPARQTWRDARARKSESGYDMSYDNITPSGPREKDQQWLIRLPQEKEKPVMANGKTSEFGPATEAVKFFSEHWDEPNVLLHIRVDERRAMNGQPFLNVIEIQSDWMQEYARVGKQLNDPNHQGEDMSEQPPKAPFTKTWPDLALKKVLIEAVKRGYDRIVITPGDLQDQFQGAAEPGRAVFYDKILPGKLLDIVRKFDSSARFTQLEMNIHDAQGLVEEGVEQPKTKFVPVLELTPDIVKGVQNGLPLYQKAKTLQDLFSDKKRTEGVRAIRYLDKEGKSRFAVGDVGRHIQLFQELGIDIKKVQDTGLVTPTGNNFIYVGNESGKLSLGSKEAGVKSVTAIVDSTQVDILNPKYSRDSELDLFLSQDERASFNMLASGRAFIQGLKNPDFGSVIHEIAHFARRMFLTGEDLNIVEKQMGVKDGEWSVEQEEKFVKWFELALRKGRSPVPQMQGVFSSIGEYLKRAKSRLETSERRITMNQDLSAAIDHLFWQDREPVVSQRKANTETETDIRVLRKRKEELESTPIDPSRSSDQEMSIVQELTQVTNDLKSKQEEYRSGLTNLKRELDKQFTIGATNYGEKRRAEFEMYSSAEATLDPESYAEWKDSYWQSFRERTEQVSAKLGSTKAARVFLTLADEVGRFAKSYWAKYGPVFQKSINAVSRKGRNWALVEDHWGYTNDWRKNDERDFGPSGRITDEQVKREVPDMLAYYAGRDFLHDEEQRQARAMGQTRHQPSGDIVVAKEQYERRAWRMLVPTGREWLLNGGKEVDQWIRDTLVPLNGDLTPEQIRDLIKQDAADLRNTSAKGPEDLPKNRTRGALEMSRRIEHVPPIVLLRDKNGAVTKRIELFHTDPKKTLELGVTRAANRLGVARYFGWGVLKNVFMDGGVLSDTLKAFGQSTEFNKADLVESMVKSKLFDTSDLSGLTVEKLKELAKKFDLPTGLTAESMWGTLQGLLPQDAKDPVRAERVIRELATKVGGVNSKGHILDVLNGLKERISQNIEDRVLEKLLNQHVEEGGRSVDMINNFRRLQGYPIFNMQGHVGWNAFQIINGVTGTMMTTLAPFKGLFQTARSVTGSVGPLTYFKALAEVVTNMPKAWQQGLEAGAYRDAVHTWAADTNGIFNKSYEILKQGAGILIGHERVAQFNNVIAATAYRIFADDIKATYQPRKSSVTHFSEMTGTTYSSEIDTAKTIQQVKDAGGVANQFLRPWDQVQLKKLRINAVELDQIASGKMTPETYDKIIQNGVATTQHITEAGHRKSLWEQDPRMQTLVAFQSFAYGEARRLSGEMGVLRKAWLASGGSPIEAMKSPAFRASAASLLATVGLALGTNALMKAGLGRMRGTNTDPSDDTWWSWTGGALIESTILSQVTWAVTPWEHTQNGPGAVLGYFPHVSALANFAGWLLGVGRYAEFGRTRAGAELVESMTPLAKAVHHQIELNSFPDLAPYERTRNAAAAWKRANLKQADDTSVAPMNPDYEKSWVAATRGDFPGLVQASTDYYTHQLQKGVDTRDASAKLRASLLAHRPIALNAENKLRFLAGLDKERLNEAYQTDQYYEALVDVVAPGK